MRPGGLTPKQEAFVHAYLETSNATEAYRRAYDCSAMTDKSINENASKLLKNAKVAPRLQVLQERVAAKAVLSRAWIIEQLMDNTAKAKIAADFTASNKALELLGKTDEMQMFVERSAVTSDNRHHHSAEPLSPFAEHLAEMLGAGTEATPEKPVQN
jgi:phage terminase small subunit